MAENVSEAEPLPIPEEKAIGDERFITTWRVTLKKLPPGAQILTLLHSLDKPLSVSIEHAEGTELLLTVTRDVGTSHADGYLAAWFVLERLEETVDPIAFIQGIPKEKWKFKFPHGEVDINSAEPQLRLRSRPRQAP